MKLPSRLRTSLLHRRQLAADVVHVGAAHGQLGFELRVVGPEAELQAPVGHERLQPREQGVGVRFSDPVRVEALEEARRLAGRSSRAAAG